MSEYPEFDAARRLAGRGWDPVRAAKLFDVPPWCVAGGGARPRFAVLRWLLRHRFPGLVWK